MHDWSGVNLLDPWHPMAMFLNIPQTRETKIALRSRSCPFGQWLYLASTTMRVWTLQQDMQTSREWDIYGHLVLLKSEGAYCTYTITISL